MPNRVNSEFAGCGGSAEQVQLTVPYVINS